MTWMLRGCSSEVIQEVISAVKYFNIDGPSTAACRAPVETDLSGDFAFRYCWMSTVKPARGMGTTPVSSNTWRRHFCPRISLETIPSIQWSITNRRRWTVGHFPVTVGQILVVQAIWNVLWANTLAYFDCYLFHQNKTDDRVFNWHNKSWGLLLKSLLKERILDYVLFRAVRLWRASRRSITSRFLKHLIILMLLVNLKAILEKRGKPLTRLLSIAPTIQRWKNWSWMAPLFLILVSFLMLLMTGPHLAIEIPLNDNNNDLSYINNINVNYNKFSFPFTSSIIVFSHLNKLCRSKATSLDNISAKIIRECADLILVSLCDFFKNLYSLVYFLTIGNVLGLLRCLSKARHLIKIIVDLLSVIPL